MPFALAKKIVDEISSETFSARHRVCRISVGENGDAFLNRECLAILRYIKQELPAVDIECYTNFQNFTPEKAEPVLSEGLVSRVYCNMDGASGENYSLVKGLDLQGVSRNITAFLDIRKRTGSHVPLHMQAVTLHAYLNAVRSVLGAWPLKMNGRAVAPEEVRDDFPEIRRRWGNLLDQETDSLVKVTGLYLWAERGQVDTAKIDYSAYSCPQLAAIREQAYISPAGDWYACCEDAACEAVFGNLGSETLDSIYSGRARKEFLMALERRDFPAAGAPCRTVNCCQKVYYDSDDRVLMFKLKFPRLFALLKSLAGRG